MDLFTTPPAASAWASASALASGILSESSQSESSVNPPGKTRSACNRCHAQKLKCLRKTGQGSRCERCLRLKTSCRFGPRAARSSLKLPEQVPVEVTVEDALLLPASIPMSTGHSDTAIAGVGEIEWLFPLGESTDTDGGRVTQTDLYYSMPDYVDTQDTCWAPFFGVERNVNHLLAFGGSANLDLTPVHDNVASANTFCSPAMLEPCMGMDDQDTVDHLDLTPPSIVQRLASLDVALYECGLEIPSPINAGSDSVGISTRKSKLFVLNELFRLTTDFLDIFSCLSHEAGQLNLSPSSTIQTESDAESTLPLFTYSQRLSKTIQPAGIEEPTSPFPHLDEATMFMIVSCHCRLTEIYVSLFEMMQACVKHSLAPRRDKDWSIILPQLQVGSIASPPVHVDFNTPLSPATSSMYMLMITMLSSQLWEQLADKTRVSDGISVKMGSRSVLTKTVWENVTDKNDRMSQTIDNTRRLLQPQCVVAA